MVGVGHGRAHVLEVRPQFRMVLGDLVLPNAHEEHDGAAVGVAELSEQLMADRGEADQRPGRPTPIEEAA
jgi:hypothetical protein